MTGYIERELREFDAAFEDFNDSSQEWRRLFSELLGTSSSSLWLRVVA